MGLLNYLNECLGISSSPLYFSIILNFLTVLILFLSFPNGPFKMLREIKVENSGTHCLKKKSSQLYILAYDLSRNTFSLPCPTDSISEQLWVHIILYK